MQAGDLFELLRDGRPRTRAQLARSTGLARSTIAARIEELIQLGLVMPTGGGASTGGRPPSLFRMNPRGRVVAGVDIGATHALAVLADLSGAILTQRAIAMDVSEGPEVVLSWLVETCGDLVQEQGRQLHELAAIGIGLPGPVEHSSGRPINPPIMPGWDRFDVPGRVQRALDVPVLVDNDVNIMALGERRAMFSQVQDLVFVKVATGIGAGIISGGSLQRGAQGTAGDLGHVRVAGADAVRCRCGNTGCLEAVASGPALATALRGAGVNAQSSQAQSSQDVVDQARAGNLAAVQAVRQGGRDIGDVLATLVNLINPSVVVIGGRVAAAGEYLLAGIKEVVFERSMPLATEHLRVVPSQVGREAAALGAVSMAIDHVLAPAQIERAVRTMAGAT